MTLAMSDRINRQRRLSLREANKITLRRKEGKTRKITWPFSIGPNGQVDVRMWMWTSMSMWMLHEVCSRSMHLKVQSSFSICITKKSTDAWGRERERERERPLLPPLAIVSMEQMILTQFDPGFFRLCGRWPVRQEERMGGRKLRSDFYVLSLSLSLALTNYSAINYPPLLHPLVLAVRCLIFAIRDMCLPALSLPFFSSLFFSSCFLSSPLSLSLHWCTFSGLIFKSLLFCLEKWLSYCHSICTGSLLASTEDENQSEKVTYKGYEEEFFQRWVKQITAGLKSERERERERELRVLSRHKSNFSLTRTS